MKIKIFLLLFVFASLFSMAQPKQVIFDTDMGPDYDDVGAITVLHNFADKGKAEILATIASTQYEGVASVLNVLNTYFKRPEIPIAIAGTNGLALKDFQHWSDTLVNNYPHKINSNKDVMKAVELYRKLLAQAKDTSISIITVGFFTNIADLLKSKPDKYSKLPGAELVKQKVKALYSMAGRFPSGKEFNVHRDAASSIYVFTHWPRPVYISGFEIGEKIFTGMPLVNNPAIQNSPVKDVYRICTALSDEDRNGRKSWDQTAVLIAVDDLHKYYTLEEGQMIVDEDGSNSWDRTKKGQYRIIEKLPVQEVTNVINTLMMR
ncbi:MAG TPA: nucleoside hydrolase [Flavitalea sp.]|nr:nucleoside hydrolase [Flavitalea sp.]